MNRLDRRPRSGVTGRRSSRGQATVEFAMLLPLLALVGLAVVQVALVADARVQLTHAARAGARVAAVGATDEIVRRAVTAAVDVDESRLRVAVERTPSTVEVTVTYDLATTVPLVGRLVDDVQMVAVARMPREPP